MPSPQFLIIGAQKCGTTSLYRYLLQHPQVRAASQKEIHFFDFNYHLGLDWYRSQFPEVSFSDKIITGEASPYYIFHPLAPQRIYQEFPNIKLIALFRNPVDRAISHYHHEVQLGFEDLPLEDAIAAESDRVAGERDRLETDPTYYSYNHQHYTYLARGIYIEQLHAWRKFFDPQQLLVLVSEEFFADPASGLAKVCQFLQLPTIELSEYSPHNARRYPEASESARQQLGDYFRSPNQQLSEYLRRKLPWD